MINIDKAFTQILFFLFCLFLSVTNCLSQTNVPAGNVSGTWAIGESPFVVEGNITVAAGQKLTIEPGVKILFNGNYTLNINGTLLARGTAADSIIIDQFDDKSLWHSIRIENVDAESDSTIFEYCRIAHANYESGDVTTNGGNAVLVKNFDKVRISHCLLRNNKGGRGAGVYAERANIKINDNVIRNNSVVQYGAGIYVEAGSPLIQGNRIEKNYGGDVAGGIWLSASNSQVENNIISYNSCYWSGAGVVLTNNSNSILLHNLISYNESGHDDGGGLLISGSSPKIINNTIAFNKSEVGEGVFISGSSDPVFINTIIYGNRDRYQDENLNDEIYIETSNAHPGFYNCNIQAGISGIVTYSGIFNGIAKDNIEGSPLFKDVAANDFSLLWDTYPVADNSKSPCIDGGTLDSPHDPDGSTADIGARYFHQAEGNFPPRVNFLADTLLGINALAVTFRDFSDEGSGNIIEWHWNFGDGGTSTEQNPVHEYTQEGRFDVTLKIKDETGFERRITKEKHIRIIDGVYVKGKINGIYNAPRYVVGGDLLVEETKTLEVKPGVEFMFLGAFKLEVRGALQALGTAIQPIIFTSYDTTGLDLAHAVTSYSEKPVGWAGIYVYASGAQDSTVINHCRVQFVENSGLGAIYAFAANGASGMRISNSEISYNSTQGITVFSSDIIIRNNYIHHNYARVYQKGAGIYFWAGSPKIINNIIANNETADDGGGICVDWDSRPSLIGNVITHNKASRGGGICDYAGWMELINNTIAFNVSTSSSGGGYYILYAGDVKFTNSIITNNFPTQVEVADWYTKVGFRNSILQGGSAGIVGYATSVIQYENVLTDDPKLVPGNNGHGRLLSGSPAVDTGITDGITSLLPSFDVAKNTRIVNSNIDIGAYEYVPEAPLLVVNPIADVNQEEDFNPFTVSLESVFGFQYGSEFLSYSIDNTADINLLNVDIRDRSLYFTSVRDKFGDQTVSVTASSGLDQITSSFIVHISPVDDAPQFSVRGDMYVWEDFIGSKSYEITFTIPLGEENQPRTFTLEPSSVDFFNIQFNDTGTLAFTAKPNLFGSQRFKLTLTEGSQAYSESFTFGVQSVNDPPAMTVDNSPITLKEGEEKILPVVVSDVEGDAVTLTSQAANDFISLSSNSTGIDQYNIVVTGQTPASSGVSLSASDGNSTTIVTIPVTVTLVVGLEEEATQVGAYPNPSIDYIIVNAKAKSSIIMYNTSGQMVLQDKVGSTEHTLSVRHLTPGLYLLFVDDGVKQHLFKIMKK